MGEKEVSEYNKIVAALKDLVDAAKSFLSDSVIVETTGTLPLLDALDEAVGNAEVLLPQVESDTGEPVGRRVQ